MLLRALVFGPLRSNGLRTVVTLIAVALGVAIGLAIDLANATAVASFASSVNVVSNHVNLQVLGIGHGFDERTLLKVAQIPGVVAANPAIEDSLTVGARPGEPFSGEILRVLGVDLLQPLPGGAEAAQGPPGAPPAVASVDPAVVVEGHGAFVSARIAARLGWRRGATVRALTGDHQVTLRIAGILPGGAARIDSSVVFVDIATAQEIFGKIGRLDRIDIEADPVHIAAVQRAVAQIVPPDARVIRPAVRTDEIARMLQSFRLNLAALAYVALLVGMYLIYNTVAISVVQRRPDIGTVRALGATRAAVFGVFLSEGALIGAAGATLGLGLGAALANASVAAVSRTVDAIYVASYADRVSFDPLLFVKAFAFGVIASIVAAAFPAWEAATTAPAITMRAQGFERPRPRFAARAALVGLGSLLIAFALTRLPAVDGVPLFGYLSGLLVIGGGSLFAPAAVEMIALAGTRLAARRPALGLAAANFAGAPLRISVAVASLMIAIAMMVAVAVLVASFRTTIVAWAGETLTADLFVRPMGLGDASTDATFSPHVAERVARVHGVAEVGTLRSLVIPLQGRLTTLAATDLVRFVRHSRPRLLDGGDPAALIPRLPGSTEVLVSEPFATKFGVRAGDTLALPTPSGTTPFRVGAVYNDYSSDAGVVLVDLHTYRRLFHDDTVSSMEIFARPGVDLIQLRTAVLRAVAPLQIDIETNRELRGLVIAIFDRTFAITYALDVIAITIAMLGVVSTLFALVLERRREFGLLRYLGVTRSGIRATVLTEAAGIGVLGGGLGVVLGMVLALLLIFVINRQAFGWLIELHVPWAFLAETILIVLGAAVVAGIYPARVAARIRTADAVRTE